MADTSGGGRRTVRKVRQGRVVSDAMDKTVVVAVDRVVAHPLYGKRMTRRSRFHAHDEDNEYRVGDIVRIEETRPLSKRKRWRIIELVERPE
ncbi:MAG: 30S ribosomal protein S17 [Gemmatimonadota bacterium]